MEPLWSYFAPSARSLKKQRIVSRGIQASGNGGWEAHSLETQLKKDVGLICNASLVYVLPIIL